MDQKKMLTADEVIGGLSKLAHSDNQSGKALAIGAYALAYYNTGTQLPQTFLDATTDNERLDVILNSFMVRQQVDEENVISSIEHAFSQLNEDELEQVVRTIRAFIFDCDVMSDDGIRYDTDGTAAENSNFSPIPGKSVRPWQSVEYVHRSTKDIIESDAYNGLPPVSQKEYDQIKFMFLREIDCMPRLTMRSKLWLKAGIKYDISMHPEIAIRYLCEIGIPYTGNPDGGLIYEFRDTVAEAVNHLHALEYAKGTQLSKVAATGIAKGWLHIQIAILATLMCDYTEQHMRGISDEDIERYVDLIEVFLDPTLEALPPEDELDSYRDADGDALPGMNADKNIIKNNATPEQQWQYLRNMAEELLVRLHNIFGNRNDVRTNDTIKRLEKIYYEIILQ